LAPAVSIATSDLPASLVKLVGEEQLQGRTLKIWNGISTEPSRTDEACVSPAPQQKLANVRNAVYDFSL